MFFGVALYFETSLSEGYHWMFISNTPKESYVHERSCELMHVLVRTSCIMERECRGCSDVTAEKGEWRQVYMKVGRGWVGVVPPRAPSIG